MYPKLEMYLYERKKAEIRGDWGVFRSITADLERMGHFDAPPIPIDAPPAEKPHGRPRKLPKCEHGQVAERCVECWPELLTS